MFILDFEANFGSLSCGLSQPRFSNSTGSKTLASRFWFLAESILSSICSLFAVLSTDATQRSTATSRKGVPSLKSMIYLLSKHIYCDRSNVSSHRKDVDMDRGFLSTGKYGTWGTRDNFFFLMSLAYGGIVLPLCPTDVSIYDRLLSVCWNSSLHQLLPFATSENYLKISKGFLPKNLPIVCDFN